MITSSDSYSTIDLEKYYAILPADGITRRKYESNGRKFKMVREGFAYNSGTNKEFLTKEDIRILIRENLDSNFKPV